VNYFDIANNTETTLSHKGSGVAAGVIGTCPNAGPGGLDGPDLRLLDPKLLAVPGDDAPPAFCHNGTFSVYLYGNETVRLIKQHEPTTPMYIYLAWNSVHSPCEAPEEYVHNNMNIADGQRRQFASMINAVDDALLQIVDTLKAKEMYSTTIMVVTTVSAALVVALMAMCYLLAWPWLAVRAPSLTRTIGYTVLTIVPTSQDNGGNLGGAGNNLPFRFEPPPISRFDSALTPSALLLATPASLLA
jgi:hypothetical protein